MFFKKAQGKKMLKLKMHTRKQEDSIFLSQTDDGKVDLVQLGKSFPKVIYNYKNTRKAANCVMP